MQFSVATRFTPRGIIALELFRGTASRPHRSAMPNVVSVSATGKVLCPNPCVCCGRLFDLASYLVDHDAKSLALLNLGASGIPTIVAEAARSRELQGISFNRIRLNVRQDTA